jgi:predicted enzyme related to lactoylglutathione lyase
MVQTFEWDGMPGHVAVNTMTLEDLGDGRTKLVSVSAFMTTEERDGMLHSGMEQGAAASYEALDRLLASPPTDAAPRRAVRKVAFSLLPIVDVPRARKFYEETLGLAVGMHGGREGRWWIEYDLPGGGCLALSNAIESQPSANAGGTLALEVDDLARLMDRLKTEGVVFKSDVIHGPRCRMAVCLDSEGNALLLHELDRAEPGA